jgi:hypothetical protein
VIKIPNYILLILGVIFFLIGRQNGEILPSFMFGLCLGIIFLNYQIDKKKHNGK